MNEAFAIIHGGFFKLISLVTPEYIDLIGTEVIVISCEFHEKRMG